MDIGFINPFAILLAAISTFVIGYPWYGDLLFGKTWLKESKAVISKNPNMAKTMGTSFGLALIQATLLEMFIGPDQSVGFGIFVGLAVGAGWVATSIANSYLFEGRSKKLLLINGGYNIVIFVVMSVILSLI